MWPPWCWLSEAPEPIDSSDGLISQVVTILWLVVQLLPDLAAVLAGRVSALRSLGCLCVCLFRMVGCGGGAMLIYSLSPRSDSSIHTSAVWRCIVWWMHMHVINHFVNILHTVHCAWSIEFTHRPKDLQADTNITHFFSGDDWKNCVKWNPSPTVHVCPNAYLSVAWRCS